MNDARILVVDDSPDAHLVLARQLRLEGLELFAALTSDEGLDGARSLQPALILLDMNLDRMSGLDFYERLKEDAHTSDIPVLFLTSDDTIMTKLQAFELGAVDYLVKPYSVAELRARVKRALAAKRDHDRLARIAYRDADGELFQRRHCEDELRRQRNRHETQAVVLVGIDDLPALRAHHGATELADLVRRTAAALARSQQPTALLCRLDEGCFALFIARDGQAAAEGAIAAMRVETARLVVGLDDRRANVGLSYGIGVADGDVDSERLVSAAQAALDRSRAEGLAQPALVVAAS